MKQLQFCTCTVLIAVFLLNLLQRQEESPIQGKAVTDLKGLIGMCQLVKSVYSTSRHKCYDSHECYWQLWGWNPLFCSWLHLPTICQDNIHSVSEVVFFFPGTQGRDLSRSQTRISFYPVKGHMVIQNLHLQIMQALREITQVLLLPIVSWQSFKVFIYWKAEKVSSTDWNDVSLTVW